MLVETSRTRDGFNKLKATDNLHGLGFWPLKVLFAGRLNSGT